MPGMAGAMPAGTSSTFSSLMAGLPASPPAGSVPRRAQPSSAEEARALACATVAAAGSAASATRASIGAARQGTVNMSKEAQDPALFAMVDFIETPPGDGTDGSRLDRTPRR